MNFLSTNNYSEAATPRSAAASMATTPWMRIPANKMGTTSFPATHGGHTSFQETSFQATHGTNRKFQNNVQPTSQVTSLNISSIYRNFLFNYSVPFSFNQSFNDTRQLCAHPSSPWQLERERPQPSSGKEPLFPQRPPQPSQTNCAMYPAVGPRLDQGNSQQGNAKGGR